MEELNVFFKQVDKMCESTPFIIAIGIMGTIFVILIIKEKLK